MKVLLISPLPPPAGGIATWTKKYLESKMAQENEIDLINVAVIGKRSNKIMAKKNLLDETNRLFSCIANLKKKLVEKKYDVVHLNSSCSSFGLIRDLIMAKIVKKHQVKLLVHLRCDVTYMLKSKMSVFLFKKLIKSSDCILTLNKVSQLYIMELCGKESVILPNYISGEYIAELNKKKEIKENAEKILFVGHITSQKGCDLIFKIAREFSEKEFILVGTASEEMLSLPKPDNICLKGELPLTDIIQEYLNADIFLFPTHTEGFPNVVTEAMACGMPIVSTPVGAIPDMLEDKGGILVTVDDEKSLIDAIKEINSEEIRTRMSAFNKEKVKDNYVIDEVLEKLFDIYSRMVEL